MIQFNKFSMPFYILNWWVGFMWGQISLNPFRIKPKENEGIVFGEGAVMFNSNYSSTSSDATEDMTFNLMLVLFCCP